MYKLKIDNNHEMNAQANKSFSASTGLRSVISVRRPSSRSSSWKNSVLSHNKIHPENVEVHARILDTSPVVVKTRFAVVIPLNAKDKESIASQSTSLFKQVRALRSYMQTKAKMSRKW
ncbi:hypothetical protein Tco_0100191 [Tanacetum coccineum]